MSLTTGTAKVGRWEYPAVQGSDGIVRRNTKRDGSGSFTEPVDVTKFTATGAVEPEVVSGYSDTRVVSDDYEALEAVHLAVFNSGIWANRDDIQVNGLTEKRATELVRVLIKADLVVSEKSTSSDGFDTGETIYSSSPNWDEVSEDESLALFAAAIPADIVVKHAKIGGHPVTNNTHKKPGRSSWAVGDTCPQGHVLAEGDVYVMPSGRKQCVSCRKGYPSNI